MTTLNQGFDHLADETPITTGNSGGTGNDAASLVYVSGSTMTADTAVSAAGGVSARIDSSGSGSARFDWAMSGAKLRARGYFYFDSTLPTSDTTILYVGGDVDDVCRTLVQSTSKLRVWDNANADIWTAAAALSTGTWYRVEMIVDLAAGTVRVAYYAGHSTTPIEDSGVLSSVAMGSNTAITNPRFGKASTAAYLGTFHIDELRVDDSVSASFIGPWVDTNVAPVVSAGLDQAHLPGATVTLTATATDSDGSIASSSWTQTAGSPTVVLAGSGLSRTFTMPSLGDGESLTFEFSATDDDGATSTDTMDVTGVPATTGVTHHNDAEGGASGAIATSASSGGGSGDAFQGVQSTATGAVTFDDTHAAHGSLAYKLSTASGQYALLVWSLAATRCALRAYLYLEAPPTADSQLMVLRTSGPAIRLDISTGRILRVNTVAGGVEHIFADPIPLNTWVRLELFANTTAGEGGALWAIGDGYPQETWAIQAAGIGAGDLTYAQIGKLSSTAWAATLWVDDIAANTFADGFIGPWAASYTAPADAGADQLNLEPWTTVTLEGTGVGTWAQDPTDPVQVVLEGVGSTVTYQAPAVAGGCTLHFTYGGTPTTHTVLFPTDYAGTRPIRIVTGTAIATLT